MRIGKALGEGNLTPRDAESMRAEHKEKQASESKRNVVLENILDAAGTKRVTSTGKRNVQRRNCEKNTAKLSSTSHEVLGDSIKTKKRVGKRWSSPHCSNRAWA